MALAPGPTLRTRSYAIALLMSALVTAALTPEAADAAAVPAATRGSTQGQAVDPATPSADSPFDHWTLTASLTGKLSGESTGDDGTFTSAGSVSASWTVAGDVAYGWNDQTTELTGSGSATEHTVEEHRPNPNSYCGEESTETLDGAVTAGSDASIRVTTGITEPPPDGSEHGQLRYAFQIAPPTIEGGQQTDSITEQVVNPPRPGDAPCTPATNDPPVKGTFELGSDGCGPVVCQGDVGTQDTTISHSYTYTDPDNESPAGKWNYTFSYTISIGSCQRETAPAASIRAVTAVRAAAATSSKQSSCLAITSPAKDSIIALTDGKYFSPQPDLADTTQRAPASRSLEVKGTDKCGCPVTVNGKSAKVSGQTWTVKLPAPKPGDLTITAKADNPSQDQASEKITIVDLKVTSPNDGETVEMDAEPAPKMPKLDATVTVAGYPGSLTNVTYEWTLTAFGEYRTRPNKNTLTGHWEAYEKVIANGTTVGNEKWEPDYSEMLGGEVEVLVRASIPKVLDGPTDSDPFWFGLVGNNAEPKTVLNYVASAAGTDSSVVQHIDCFESNRTYNEFKPSVEGREPIDPEIPADLRQRHGWRPFYGAPPSGIGIGQLDPAKFPEEQWNWQTNVDGSIATYQTALSVSMKERDVEQSKLNRQYVGAQALVNAMRLGSGLPPISGVAAVIPDMTKNQHIRDAIRRYNSGKEYRYDLAYYPDFTSLTVDAVGTARWVLSPNPNNQGYVHDVMNCTAGGLQPLSLPVPNDTPPPESTTQGGIAEADASGFQAGEQVNVELHSKAVELGTYTADTDAGSVDAVVKIPAGTPPGQHALVLVGKSSGLSVSVPLIVKATTGAVGKSSGLSVSVPPSVKATTGGQGRRSLASTGFAVVPYLTTSLLLLVAGMSFLLIGRRRKPPAHRQTRGMRR